MKILFGCGCLFGFRGNSEHTNFKINSIERDTFEAHHKFAGYEFFKITGMYDKTHPISVNNPHPRGTSVIMRIPILNDGMHTSDLGGSIDRYLAKLAPGQFNFYTQAMT